MLIDSGTRVFTALAMRNSAPSARKEKKGNRQRKAHSEMIRIFLDHTMQALIASSILLTACKKEENEGSPTSPVLTASISSICLGEWRADSSFIISISVYQTHPPSFITFTPDGRMSMTRSDGSTENLTFRIGDEEVNVRPGEYGRSLIWFEDPEAQFEEPWGAALLVFQSPTECNMMFTDDITPTWPASNSLTTIHEYVVIENDPVFDVWSKCYSQ